MTPGHSGRVQEDLHVGVAAEHVLALVDRDAAVRPFHEEGGFAAATSGPAGPGLRQRLAKRVAEPVDGPDESRPGGIVAERVANLADQIGEVLLDDKRGGPQTLLQIALGDRLRPVGDEDAQQVERFR